MVPHVDSFASARGLCGCRIAQPEVHAAQIAQRMSLCTTKGTPACTTATPKIHSCLLRAGYTNASGGFSSGLLTTLNYVDRSIGTIYQALINRGLTPSTAIIITAKHGQQVTSFGRMRHALLPHHYCLMLPGNQHQPGAAWRPAATSAPPMTAGRLLCFRISRAGAV